MKSKWPIHFKIFTAFMFIVFAWIAYNLTFVFITGTKDGRDLREYGKKQTLRETTLLSNRGNIFDISGKLLAANKESFDVFATLKVQKGETEKNPKHIVDITYAAEELAKILGGDKSYYVDVLSQKNVVQVELGPKSKNISLIQKEELLKSKIPGLLFENHKIRTYVNGDFASYLIGYAKQDEHNKIIGEMGVEQFYNKELSSVDGNRKYYVDSQGNKLPGTTEKIIEPKDGNNIYLTINQKLQSILEEALSNTIATHPAEYLGAIIADPKDGKILAATSKPSFDPNTRENIKSYVNPLVADKFEPGSTFKVFTWASALKNNMNKNFDADILDKQYQSGNIERGEIKIYDHNTYGWGTINFKQGFYRSSNLAAINLIERYIGYDKFKLDLDKLGFGKKTGISIANENAGNIQYKYLSERATVTFGQGISVNAMQMIQAMTAIAGNGDVVKPQIIEKITDPNNGRTIKSFQREVITKDMYPKEVRDAVLQLMADTTDGKDAERTGRLYHVPGYTVGTKTGTAQISDSESNYAVHNYELSFKTLWGIAPAKNPKVMMFLFTKRMSDPLTGMPQLFVPLARNILSALNIKEDNPEEVYGEDYKYSRNKIKLTEMPSFLNLTKAEANEIAKKNNLNLVFIGKGDYILDQSIIPFQEIYTNDKIILKLSNDIKMPDLTDLSYRTLMQLEKMINVKFKITGSGYVSKQSVQKDSKISSGQVIDIELKEK